RYLPAAGVPLLVLGLLPFAFVGPHTSYWLLCGFSVALGLGMGLALMPSLTAALQSVPQGAIARTSTAMNIIRQAGASIGTAILTVVLSSAITSRLRAAGHAVAPGQGFGSLQHAAAHQHALAGPLASAFSSTFVWALVLL